MQNFTLIGSVLWLTFALCSCRGGNYENVITVDVNSDQMEALASRIEVTKIIALDNSTSVGEVRKVAIHDGRYWVLNKSGENILCYDGTGNQAFAISRQGRGPEEYLFIQNFYIDPFAGGR